MTAVEGLVELGEGLYAYLQAGRGWGYANAGLVTAGGRTLLVDTLYDLELTGRMLEAMRARVPAARRIDTLVNTHANGDHTFGNQLVGEARIVASAATAAEMTELPPAAMAAILEQAPQMGAAGAFFKECFGDFAFAGIELRLPDQTFSGELELDLGGLAARLVEVGPAHTRGDTLVYLPGCGVMFTGDILFHQSHPIAWAGPVSNWIAACDRILDLAPEIVVPGHGPVADLSAVREQRAYLQYLSQEVRRCRAQGMDAHTAARAISLDRWATWGEPERVAVNVLTLYRELEGEPGGPDALSAFTAMAELHRERAGRERPARPGQSR